MNNLHPVMQQALKPIAPAQKEQREPETVSCDRHQPYPLHLGGYKCLKCGRVFEEWEIGG